MRNFQYGLLEFSAFHKKILIEKLAVVSVECSYVLVINFLLCKAVLLLGC